MRRLCFVLLLLVLPTQAFAQSVPTPYKLRHPSAEEYLSAMPNLLSQAETDYEKSLWPGLLADTAQFRYLQDKQLDFQQIDQALRTFLLSFYSAPRQINLAAWYSALVEAWLNEKPVDLDISRQLSRDGYFLDVEPRDFKGDGGHEWLLSFRTLEGSYFDVGPNFLVAERLASGLYRIVRPPLPWFSAGFGYYESPSGVAKEILFRDLSGDNVPEWVVTLGGIFSSGGLQYGELNIFKWQNGQFVNLAYDTDIKKQEIVFFDSDSRILPDGVRIDFVPSMLNIGQQDVRVRQAQHDSFGCTWSHERQFGWNGQRFSLIQEHRSYAPVQECAWRDAETAMWNGNTAEAVQFYERGLTLPLASVADMQERAQYMKYRLVLAYSLKEDQVKSDDLLKTLKGERPTSVLMKELIDYTPEGANSFWKCMAAYNVVDRYSTAAYYAGDIEYLYNLPTNLILGMNIESTESIRSFDIPRPDPRRAGCDPTIAIQTLVSTAKFTLTAIPVEQLRLLGLNPVQSQTFDLNKDRRDEWLIWLDVPTPPLFFSPAPASGTYTVSFAPIPANARGSSLNLRPLPDNLDNVLIGKVPITSEHSCPAPIGQDPTLAPPPWTAIRIWRIIKGHLEILVEAPICDTDAEGWSTDPTKSFLRFSAYAVITPGYQKGPADLAFSEYTWNSEKQTFLPSQVVSDPDQPRVNTTVDQWSLNLEIRAAFARQDYRAVATIVDNAMIHSCRDCNLEEKLELLYWRATALELMGDEYGAVADYATIYRNAPSPLWRQLIALHLELPTF